jgi:hypothetical protein
MECPNCGEEIEIEITPGTPARNLHGAMEDAIPEELPTWDPSECECGREITLSDIEAFLN